MGNLEQGSTAIVSTESTGLRLRSHPVINADPNDNVIAMLPRHSTVRIDGPPGGGFYPVTAQLPAGPTSGYASSSYLTFQSGPPAAPPPMPEFVVPSPAADFVVPVFVPGVVDVPLPLPVLVDPGVVGPLHPAVVVEEPNHARRNALILGGAAVVVVGVGAALLNRSHAKSLHR